MSLKIAIIDDELHAIETLVFDLNENFGNDVQIIFTATNPVEGLKKVKRQIPDLLFLDVEMPGLSGIDILELVDDLDLKVVVTTAHEEFAMKAVGTRAIAFLLKPIHDEQLRSIIADVERDKQLNQPATNGKLAVPVFDGIEIVRIQDIVYCQSESNYTTLFFLDDQKLIASKTLKYFTETLSKSPFLRIHKSYLINLNHIKKYLKKEGGEVLMANNDILPVSRSNRDLLLKLIQNNH